MSLADLRAELDGIDRQLIDLAARRCEIAREIAAVKKSSDTPTRDFTREKVVIDRARARAADLGLAEDLAEELLLSLIRGSLTTQEQHRVAVGASGAGRHALVIGGAGKMGSWFADFLDSQGFAVTVADPAPAKPHFTQIRDWRTDPLDADLIVVATPLRATNDVLLALADRRPAGVIFDLGSLKTPLVTGIEALREARCQVTSLHPMFGPDTQLLSGRHVLFVEVGAPQATAAARALFANTMAAQVEVTLEEHDRVTAFVLGLSHALNIAFSAALACSGESEPRLAAISSTTFDAQVHVAKRVSGENPHLYWDIQALNAYGDSALAALDDAVRRIRAAVIDGDEDAFVKLMRDGAGYFERSP